MLTALVIDDIGSQAAIQDKLQALGDVSSIAETIVVSTDEKPASLSSALWTTGPSLVEAFDNAIELSASKRIMIISSALQFEAQDISRLAAEIATSPMLQHTIVIPHNEHGPMTIPDMRAEGIIASLTNCEMWPLLCVGTTRATLRSIRAQEANCCTEAIAKALINALGDGDSVCTSSNSSPLISKTVAKAISEISATSRANILRSSVDSMNIEELFPNLSWKEFSQESAAAAYHTLAALFLRFGDAEAAEQSLRCSERLEESPRFFALLGLIQQSQGETLGAVANFVSSLQCYEARKMDDGKHYLSFKPKSLEVINSRLVDGLNALNKRDNDRALTHFSEAVFNFDSFYAELGIQSVFRSR